MGMAASQARYLELEARQTNVEYQGQQINQQRTELSEVSNGLFTQLMSLQVPTAPSSSNYTTTDYSFNNGANNCTIAEGGIQSLAGNPSYNSTVTYTYNTTPYTGIDQVRADLVARKDTDSSSGISTYWLGNVKLTAYNASSSTDKSAVDQIANDLPASPVAKATLPGSTDKIYQYTGGNTTYYVVKSQLDAMLAATGTTTVNGTVTTINGGTGSIDNEYAANINKVNTVTENAYVTQSSSGRYSSIQLQSTGSTNFDLTTTTTTNSAAYNDAMNEYTYQQAAYEQQITNINAKTSIIQNEDKTLELQLAQLDTEQKALSTELDSVKKVIDKNIETTFKTFS